LATPTPKRQEDIDFKLRAFELVERKAALRRQTVLLRLTVAFGVTTIMATIICALHGSGWPIPSGTGVSTAITGTLSVVGDRKRPPR
jgi:hypothetical protein